MKQAAQWFYEMVFQEEAIKPRQEAPAEKLPQLLRAARSLENRAGNSWQSRESVFLKQATLLVNYEDDYDYPRETIRYYPTYEALTDQELRGYFAWRTKLRKGELQPTSLSFAFLYVYELLNQIGVGDSLDGYYKLKGFLDGYGAIDQRIIPYLDQWRTDYVIYYGLDPVLLSDSAQVAFDRNLEVLIRIQEHSDAQILQAVKALRPKWLERSKFYGEYRADMDTVIARVLRKVSAHYDTRCKKTMVEQYFGPCLQLQYTPFASAVFADRMKHRKMEYHLDPLCVYRCRAGLWTVQKYSSSIKSNRKLNDLVKTIDSIMRQEYGYKHPVKCETETKWLLKLIHEEIQTLLAAQKAAQAKKVTIDYSKLDKIRQDAAITQEKLTVEEELEEEPPEAVLPEEPAASDGDCPLDKAEYRLLQCLLYGRSYAWVQSEGYLISVLLDSINDKLYDSFLDAVVDDRPAVVEDYVEDLKEMIQP